MIYPDLLDAMKSGDRARAVTIIPALLDGPQLSADQMQTLLQSAIALGEVSLVRKVSRKLCRNLPDKASAAVFHAGNLARMGQLEEACQHIRQYLSAGRATPAIHHFLGTYFMQVGDREKAEKHLRKTLREWPLAGSSWITLSNIKKFKPKDKDLAQLLSLAPQIRKTAPVNQGAYHYALGRAFGDSKDFSRAAKEFAAGAQLMAAATRYDPVAEEARTRDLIGGFSANFFETQRSRVGYAPSDSKRPIFVVGLPRSGSTLLEQMLCAHPDVTDGAELALVRSSLMPFGGYSVGHVDATQAKNQACVWSSMADTYLHLLAERFGADGRVVDKTLNNSRYLGHILLAFPNAKVIWIQRGPRDNAWSIYRSYFSEGVAFGWRFDDIQHYMTQEQALFDHWTALFPDAVLPVSYEGLVKNPEQTAALVTNFVELSPNHDLQRFHRSSRPVLTSSAIQVKAPINTAGIGVARPYTPLVPALGTFPAP